MRSRSSIRAHCLRAILFLCTILESACASHGAPLPSVPSDVKNAQGTQTLTAAATYPNGAPWPIPGSITFDNYNTGGSGVGYYSTTGVNEGGKYRKDGVSIESSTDTTGGNGYDVGWNYSGDWYAYTINVAAAGTYTASFRTASGASIPGAFHVEDENGKNLTGALQAPVTGGWQNWTTVVGTMPLSAGQHVLKFVVDGGNGFNITYVTITASSSSATPTPAPSSFPATYPSGAPWPIPGSIDFDNYDVGGQGVGYNTGTSVNQGGQYRHDGVSMAVSTDPTGGNGYYVGWNEPGDWYDYTVNVKTAAAYTVLFRVASGATWLSVAGTFHVQDENGKNLTGSLSAPVTGGWDTWTTVTGTMQLAAGNHMLRVVVDTGNGLYNFNYMIFSVPGVSPATPSPATPIPTTSPTTSANDDWITFAHDQKRTGFQSQNVGITKSNVTNLALRWQKALGEATMSSPVVAGGSIYIATEQGNVYALNATNGNTLWKTNVGNSVHMTPALLDGMLFVGTYGNTPLNQTPNGASFEALNPANGAIIWRVPLPGAVRSEPVISGGVVYEGTAGGDSFQGCTNGTLVALDERTGSQVQTPWVVSPKQKNGAGIWSPISFDGSSLYLGSGNACDVSNGISPSTPLENSILSITPQFQLRWFFKANQAIGPDEDVGGGVMLLGSNVYAETKSGIVYALNMQTGALQWEVNMHPLTPGVGGVGTPTGDGTMIIFSSGGLLNTGGNLDTDGSDQTAFDLSGNPKYTIHTNREQRGYVAFVSGIGFTPLDKTIAAFDSGTGSTLWSYPTLDTFYASPAIVPSGLYDVDLSGNVYAFGIATTKSQAAIRRPLSIVPHPPLYNSAL
jgi:outer membrane protein assembly factor BamB